MPTWFLSPWFESGEPGRACRSRYTERWQKWRRTGDGVGGSCTVKCAFECLFVNRPDRRPAQEVVAGFERMAPFGPKPIVALPDDAAFKSPILNGEDQIAGRRRSSEL